MSPKQKAKLSKGKCGPDGPSCWHCNPRLSKRKFQINKEHRQAEAAKDTSVECRGGN